MISPIQKLDQGVALIKEAFADQARDESDLAHRFDMLREAYTKLKAQPAADTKLKNDLDAAMATIEAQGMALKHKDGLIAELQEKISNA